MSEEISVYEKSQGQGKGVVSLKCRVVNTTIDTDMFSLSGLDKFVPLLMTNALGGSML